MNFCLLRAAAAGALVITMPLMVSAATTLNSADRTFAMKAAQAGTAEVKLAAVAMQKSKSPQVLSFAREMKADHSKANAQLASIIVAKGLIAPAGVGAANRRLMGRLQAQGGNTFDTMYLRSQLPAHQKVLALFAAEVANGKDPDLTAFAKQTIPVIESHIAMDKRDIASSSSM